MSKFSKILGVQAAKPNPETLRLQKEQAARAEREELELKKKQAARTRASRGRDTGFRTLLTGLETGFSDGKRKTLG